MTLPLQNWQTTDESPVPIRIAALSEKQGNNARTLNKGSAKISPPSPSIPLRTANRLPGALMGIVIFLAIGVLGFGGVTFLRGQVAMDRATIRITANGAEPTTMQLNPGAIITWQNQSDIPHIIHIDGIGGPEGIETAVIFPTESQDTTLPQDAPLGTHTFYSKTALIVSGSIEIVSANAVVAPETPVETPVVPPQSSEGTVASSTDSQASAPPNGAATTLSNLSTPEPPSPPPVDPPAPSAQPPTNPYTVAAQSARGVSREYVQEALQNSSKNTYAAPSNTQNTLAITTHRPKTSSASGNEVWIMAFFAALALVYGCYRMRVFD